MTTQYAHHSPRPVSPSLSLRAQRLALNFLALKINPRKNALMASTVVRDARERENIPLLLCALGPSVCLIPRGYRVHACFAGCCAAGRCYYMYVYPRYRPVTPETHYCWIPLDTATTAQMRAPTPYRSDSHALVKRRTTTAFPAPFRPDRRTRASISSAARSVERTK